MISPTIAYPHLPPHALALRAHSRNVARVIRPARAPSPTPRRARRIRARTVPESVARATRARAHRTLSRARGAMTRARDEDEKADVPATSSSDAETLRVRRVLVVGGGRVGAYLARVFRRGGVESVVMKASNRPERNDGDGTRAAARAIASDAGAVVVQTYDDMKTAEERSFDFVFVAVKTYALEAVKKEMDAGGITYETSSWRTTASWRRCLMKPSPRAR